jgi:hypothetical protein
MSNTYADFFRIIKKLNEEGIVNSRNYLEDVLSTATREFIPEGKVFFSSNCPQGRAISIPYAIEDIFYIVLGANYPIGEGHEILVYEVHKDKIRHLIKGDHFQLTKEIILRMSPIAAIDIRDL